MIKGAVIAATGGLDQLWHRNGSRSQWITSFVAPVNSKMGIVDSNKPLALECVKVLHGYLPLSDSQKMPVAGYAL
jgi:hypothetical protein